ncbi:hypothetical protein F2Q70_00029598 [Brassica cretica]|uniref:Uncharacterized protein n=1 Tax=Brassica cretica TaxID=69181 RepID=A0A8S9FIF9_BRACR|nr:hypothetical protein F2Q70_00029598 [Brassica cretica]
MNVFCEQLGVKAHGHGTAKLSGFNESMNVFCEQLGVKAHGHGTASRMVFLPVEEMVTVLTPP